MRTISIAIAFAALLVSGAASAAGSDKDPGKGATGPGSAPTTDLGSAGKAEGQISEVSDTRGVDTKITAKSWEVGAGVEYHHILDPEAIDNDAARNTLYYSINGRWDPTPYDRVSLRYGLYQFGIVDQGDSPVRSDDIQASYTRRIPLPGKVTLRASFALTAPISYGSQLAGLITSPRVSLQADRRFGKYFTLDARLGGTYFIFTHTTGYGLTGAGIAGNGTPGTGGGGVTDPGSAGANPNPRASLTMVLSADLAMPFHDSLSLGVSLYNGYSWVYDVGCSGSGSAYTGGSMSAFGTTMAGTCPPTTNATQGQPFFQAFAGEIYVRYALPTFGGFKSDLAATFAPNGDPTIGYASVTHGTGELQAPSTFFYYRQTAEMYFSVAGRY